MAESQPPDLQWVELIMWKNLIHFFHDYGRARAAASLASRGYHKEALALMEKN